MKRYKMRTKVSIEAVLECFDNALGDIVKEWGSLSRVSPGECIGTIRQELSKLGGEWCRQMLCFISHVYY